MKRFILGFLLIVYFSILSPALSNVAFYYYGIENGLSETQIKHICQDTEGFMWLAGENTLFRFDGNQFKNYLNRGTEQVLKGKINCLFVDSKGIFRIGTEYGFLQYDSLQDKFTGPEPGWERVHIYEMTEDHNGNLWIGTDEGLAYFDTEAKDTEWFTGPDTLKAQGNNILPYSIIRHLACQPDGKVWFTDSFDDLCLFDPAKKELVFHQEIENRSSERIEISKLDFRNNNLCISTLSKGFYSFDPKSNKLENHDFNGLGYTIHSFQHAEDSIIWLASNSGLIRYNLINEKFSLHVNDPLSPLSLTRTAVILVFVDRNNNIWVSNGIKGIDYGLINVPFSHFKISEFRGYSLTNKEVTSVTFDRKGNMWIGYEAGNIEMINPETLLKKSVGISVKSSSGKAGSVLAMFCDSKNQLWAGGWNIGLQKLNESGTLFENVVVDNDSLQRLLNIADIRGITEDFRGNIWISMHAVGIGRYNPVTRYLDIFRFNAKSPFISLSNDYTFDMCTDDSKNLWIATAHGVTKYDLQKNLFSSYFHFGESRNSLSSNSIVTVYCDHAKKIWAGTNNGLNVFLPGKNCFTPVLTDQEIPSLSINAISSVKPGEIWASSNAGIIRLNYAITADSVLQTSYAVFDRSHGLFSTTFFPRSAAADSKGVLFFGGNESVDYFDPSDVANWIKPEFHPTITDVLIDGNRVVLKRVHDRQKKPVIVLEHNNKMISIWFTSLRFNERKLNNVRYKLENFNSDWVYPQNEQAATFTNLRPGKYRFLLEIRDYTGNWINLDPPVSLVVNPPFWKTIPFFIIVVMLIITILYAIQSSQSKHYRNRQKQLETEIEKHTIELVKKNQELEVANKSKSKFFSIISHDLRSPFSSVIGILDLLNDFDNGLEEEKKKELINFAFISAKNTFDLLETLLTWARSQMNEIICNPQIHDLSALLNTNIALKLVAAKEKEISIKNMVPAKLDAFYDNDMIYTVVRNLISNALKFTNKGGEITVSARISGFWAIVSIADSGIGMSDEEMEQLFELGKHSKNGTNGERGTGLGLIICNEFVEKNKGKLWATHNQPQGTVFHFSLPLN